MAAEGLKKLAEIQQQQLMAFKGLEQLTEEHKKWRQTVEDLMLQLHSQVSQVSQSHPSNPSNPSNPFSSPLRGSSSSEPGLLPLPETNEGEVESETEGTEGTEASEVHMNYNSKMSSNALLRSRNTVAAFPAGPLRKLVMEVLADSAQAEPIDISPLEKIRRRVSSLVKSQWFEFAAGFIIFLNLITIGIEAHISVREEVVFHGGFWPAGVERLFLALYSVEASLRIIAGGYDTFKDLWFLLDLVLIIVGVTALIAVPVLAGDSQQVDQWATLLVVRGLRLFRLLRALRMLSHFKIVWRLVYGLLNAGQTIFSTTALIAVFLFIFSCVAMEVIAKDPDLRENPNTRQLVQDHFFGINKAFITLLQFVTLDNVAEVYYPLIFAKPWLCVYFFPILIFISIGLMNLVTAALVENAMQAAAIEAEEERMKLKAKVRSALPSLVEIFQELDKDHSGLITRDEVENVPLTALPPRVLDSICVENMADLFDYLDVDGTQSLTQVEFVEGLLNLCLLDMPIASLQCLKLLQLLREAVSQLNSKVEGVEGEMLTFRMGITEFGSNVRV
ncbi:unnamed protein product [Effrenium voratum]|uniref:EF-hand domain-containing protein n=1 Tax=Effrenium voratum TaxID=2562239 RepID=A0AA36NCE4_9DINO|nr:unnamed protein product [Effrenium voratum]CAJ1417040.1 unnamed protein product [Effrenium voratum]